MKEATELKNKLKQSIDAWAAVEEMTGTRGWNDYVKPLLEKTLEMYKENDMLLFDKFPSELERAGFAGEYRGVKLVLKKIEDFERVGQSAAKKLKEYKNG